MINLKQLVIRSHHLCPNQHVSVSAEEEWDWMTHKTKETRSKKYRFYVAGPGYIINDVTSYSEFADKVQNWWLKEYRQQLLALGFIYQDLDNATLWSWQDPNDSSLGRLITDLRGCHIPDNPFTDHQLSYCKDDKVVKTLKFKTWPALRAHLKAEVKS